MSGLAGEARKVKYALEQITQKGVESLALPEADRDIMDNLLWQAGKSDAEIMYAREQVLDALEFASDEQRSSGLLEKWWFGVDGDVRRVAGKVLLTRFFATVERCVCKVNAKDSYSSSLPLSPNIATVRVWISLEKARHCWASLSAAA